LSASAAKIRLTIYFEITMQIIDVIPISKGISKETLSYFTSEKIEVGQVVKMPLRSKSITGLVIGTRSASDAKAEIKTSAFELRKIDTIHTTPLFSREFMESAKDAADFFAGTTGSVLHHLVSKIILDNIHNIDLPREIFTAKKSDGMIAPRYVLQTEDEDRIAHYKSLIREQFARKSSVLFCLPTIHDIKKIITSLPKGIEDYVYIVHGALPKKEIIKTWNEIARIDHPVLVIGTGLCFSLPRSDIGAIIIERENSGAYKVPSRPYIDIRTFAEMYAKRIRAKLVLGDVLLRTETLWRQENGELTELAPIKFRSVSLSSQKVVDMKQSRSGEKEFRILSPELEELISNAKNHNEHLFIYGARRGLTPLTVCGDCSAIVTCGNCSSPVVLHKNDGESFFLCHRCGERRSAEEACKNCESWKLTTLGIGIERVEEEIKKRHPDLQIFRIDKDTVTTLKKGMAIIKKFYESPGGILIGTDLALLYVDQKIQNAAIVSIDSLFSIPDFRIQEKIMSLIVRIRAVAEKNFLLQTRNFEQKILHYALHGNLVDFYREEIKEREQFGYPPFSTFIKITLQGQKEAVQREMKKLETIFAPLTIYTFPAFIERVKGKFVMHALLRLPRKQWVDRELLAKLHSLPPQFAVKVDPESLL